MRALAALVLSGCFQATPPDGALACGVVGHECPPGYSCSDVGTCWKHTPALQLTQLGGKLGGPGAADGNGTAARFDNPLALVRDADGTLYVTDNGNNTLRKVTPDGEVTTLVGTPPYSGNIDGPGAGARLDKPTGEVLVGTTLYVRDTAGVRVVDLGTGNVRTIALDFDAAGIAFYNGQLWLTDPHSRILAYDAATGAKKITISGSEVREPRGIVSDGTGIFYVADKGSSMVYKVKSDFGILEYYGSGNSGTGDGAVWDAQFGGPQGVALDGKGNLFVADTFNCTIRKIDLAGQTVSTLAGTRNQCGGKDGPLNLGQLNWPMGLVHDGGDTLYIADYLNDSIRKLAVSTGELATVAGQAPSWGSNDGVGAQTRFNGPVRLAADDLGNLFVGEITNVLIRQIEVQSDKVSTLAGGRGEPGEIDGIAEARFDDPHAMVFAAPGTLYVADGHGHTIRKVSTATAEVSTLAGDGKSGSADGFGTAAEFVTPESMALDGQGHLYVVDVGGPTLRRIDLKTGEVTTPFGEVNQYGTRDGVGNSAHFSGPSGLAYYDGALYLSDKNDHIIRQIDLGTGYVGHFAGTMNLPGNDDGVGAGTFYRPGDLVADGRGNLLIADNGNFAIRKIRIDRGKAGEITTLAGGSHRGIVELGPLPASLNDGMGLALVAGGGLAVSMFSENSVLLIR